MNINDDKVITVKMKEARSDLLLRLEKASSASDMVELQTLLADEIINTEARIKNFKRNYLFKEHLRLLKEHLLRLRLLGDSLAWKLLHPHAIRNLAKNSGRPPTLSDRIHELDKCIKTAQWLSAKDTPAIIADLTHCLRIGDLLIVQHPEMPHIIEFKTTKKYERYQHKGRLGRQLHRMQKTIEYLNHGTAKFDNETATRMVVESDIQSDYDFELVESVASYAIRNGTSIQMIRPMQWIGACRLDSRPIFPNDLEAQADLPVVLGFVSDTLPEFINEVPPPFNWPISFNIRCALMEGELSMFHLIDLRLFQDQRIRVLPDMTFEVLVEGDWFHLSGYFLRKIIYGFESPASVVKTMINFAEKVSKLGMFP